MLSVLFWAQVLVFSALAQLAAIGVVLVGGTLWDRDRRLFHAINRAWGVALTATLPFRLELRGFDRIGPGPYVIVPNHQSVVDLLVTYRLPLSFRTVVKASWFDSPYGLAIRLAGYVPTRRSGDPESAARSLSACQGWPSRGISMLIFPEGTRSKAHRLRRFKRGPFELAVGAGVALLPVALAGTDDVAPPTTWRFSFGQRVIVEALEPVAVDGHDSHQLREVTRRRLASRVAELRAELRGQKPG